MSSSLCTGSLAFGKHNIADQSWLLRRLKEVHNELLSTPVYQEMMKRITAIKNSTALRHIALKLGLAQSAQEVEAYLHQIPEDVV